MPVLGRDQNNQEFSLCCGRGAAAAAAAAVAAAAAAAEAAAAVGGRVGRVSGALGMEGRRRVML